MPPISQYQKFKNVTWGYLKSRGYKKNGNDFIYTGREFKTIVNIQRGKFKQDNYGFYNITYARLDNEKDSIRYSDFYHMRHDFFDKNGFLEFGSGYHSFFPASIEFGTDAKIVKGIKILFIIEPLFRLETADELRKLYITEWQRKDWEEKIIKLTVQ